MKRILTATGLILAASASTVEAGNAASSVTLQEIRGYAPNADLSALSTRQICALLGIIHGGDGEGGKGATIRAYLLNTN